MLHTEANTSEVHKSLLTGNVVAVTAVQRTECMGPRSSSNSAPCTGKPIINFTLCECHKCVPLPVSGLVNVQAVTNK